MYFSYISVLLYVFALNANTIHSQNTVDNSVFKNARNGRDFTGKVVLVTGSSSGIGEGIVKLFSALGANVVVTGRKTDQVKRVAQEAQQLSPKKLKPLAIVADVTKNGDLNNLLNQTIKTFGKLDVLVNSAGLGIFSPVKDPNFMKVFDTLIKVNLRAYLKLTHLAVPYLEVTNGTIISISAVIGMVPFKYSTAYAISKAGGDIMTRTLALELGPRIRVNAINPGATSTNFDRNGNIGLDAESVEMFQKQYIKRVPMGRIGQPLDVANAAAFLASKDAQYITGANLVVDGGATYNSGGLL